MAFEVGFVHKGLYFYTKYHQCYTALPDIQTPSIDLSAGTARNRSAMIRLLRTYPR